MKFILRLSLARLLSMSCFMVSGCGEKEAPAPADTTSSSDAEGDTDTADSE